jgi:diguanylate cyclase (GGDEF)-like protein
MGKRTTATDEPPALSTFGQDAPTSVAAPAVSKGSRQRAQWLLRAVALALVVTNFALIAVDRAVLMAQTQVSNTNLARAVSERVEGSLLEIDHVTQSLAEWVEATDGSAQALQELHNPMVSTVGRTAQLDALFIYDRTGQLVVSSEASANGLGRADKEPYFQFHSGNASAVALLGRPVPFADGPLKWRLPLTRRLVNAEGEFVGILLASVSIPHLSRLLDRFDLSEGAITVTAADHHLVRRPYLPEEVGKLLNPPGPMQMADSGFGDSRSPIDGVMRLYSFEKTQSFPVRVIVASSKSEVLRGWWIASTLQTIWVLLLCLVLKRSSDHARRALRTRQEAERSLRKAHQSLAAANERLQHMAQYDELTALPNRRYFDRRLERSFKHAARENAPIALVMVDVDRFKTFNDRYGHPEGDRCLALVAAALRSAASRPNDFVARYGGEEMAMILPDTDTEGARHVAERARQAVLSAAIRHEDNPLGRVTISLGVSSWRPDGTRRVAELLSEADQALYAAKDGGRNRIVVFSSSTVRHV